MKFLQITVMRDCACTDSEKKSAKNGLISNVPGSVRGNIMYILFSQFHYRHLNRSSDCEDEKRPGTATSRDAWTFSKFARF